MNREQLLKLHEELCNKARSIMVKKNKDYTGKSGDDPFANFRRCEALGICTPLQGALVRLTDKFSRLSTFASVGRLEVEDETVDDTILDMINYAVLCAGMILEAREKKPSYTGAITGTGGFSNKITSRPFGYGPSDICQSCSHIYAAHTEEKGDSEDACKIQGCYCPNFKAKKLDQPIQSGRTDRT